jgi:hypothetical protein
MDSFIPPAGEPGEFLRIERPEDLTVMEAFNPTWIQNGGTVALAA